MNTKQFIKVTPKGGGRSIVMPAQNQSFYLAQGATIETPTREEVIAAFPEIAKAEKPATPVRKPNDNTNVVDGLRREIVKLRDTNAELTNTIADKDKRIAELEKQIADVQSTNEGLKQRLAIYEDTGDPEAAAESVESTETEEAPKTEKKRAGRPKK